MVREGRVRGKSYEVELVEDGYFREPNCFITNGYFLLFVELFSSAVDEQLDHFTIICADDQLVVIAFAQDGQRLHQTFHIP